MSMLPVCDCVSVCVCVCVCACVRACVCVCVSMCITVHPIIMGNAFSCIMRKLFSSAINKIIIIFCN